MFPPDIFFFFFLAQVEHKRFALIWHTGSTGLKDTRSDNNFSQFPILCVYIYLFSFTYEPLTGSLSLCVYILLRLDTTFS